MPTLPTELEPTFAVLEATPDLDVAAVADSLFRCEKEGISMSEAAQVAIEAERFVFTLYTDETGEKSDWGSYFRPMYVSREKDGVRTSHPLERLSADTIAYWTARANEARHAVLRARYADAAWELAQLVEGAKREISNARVAIDA
jgi:lysyl-tRNA synthetase class 1